MVARTYHRTLWWFLVPRKDKGYKDVVKGRALKQKLHNIFKDAVLDPASLTPSTHSQVHPQYRHQAVRVIRIQGNQAQDLQCQLLQDHRLRHILIGVPQTLANGPSKRHCGTWEIVTQESAEDQDQTIYNLQEYSVRKNTINHGKRTLAWYHLQSRKLPKNEVLTVALKKKTLAKGTGNLNVCGTAKEISFLEET